MVGDNPVISEFQQIPPKQSECCWLLAQVKDFLIRFVKTLIYFSQQPSNNFGVFYHSSIIIGAEQLC
jgi:hypothetical protein